MSVRIESTFARCRAEGRAALIGYLTAFDPHRAGAFERIDAACTAGLDVLELGVPFSDPTADGPAIQAAMRRALASGATLAGTLELAAELRARHSLPMVLFGYANPILHRGVESLVAAASRSGIDGLLIVDLPPEHGHELAAAARAAGIDRIGLVAPTSTDARIDRIAAHSTGFLYAVSLAGVTGAALDTASPELAKRLATLRARTSLPIAVGFGIRSADDVGRLGLRQR